MTLLVKFTKNTGPRLAPDRVYGPFSLVALHDNEDGVTLLKCTRESNEEITLGWSDGKSGWYCDYDGDVYGAFEVHEVTESARNSAVSNFEAFDLDHASVS